MRETRNDISGGFKLVNGEELRIFCGSANRGLAEQIAEYIGVPLGDCEVNRFSDGEISISIRESVRGTNSFLIQPLCGPINESIMELLIIIDALKRASVKTVNAVIPYYAYARQDRKTFFFLLPLLKLQPRAVSSTYLPSV